jgi:hypothetical protein
LQLLFLSARSISPTKYVLDAGMNCVDAIGEKLPDREKGLEATMAVCIDQLAQVKSLLDPEKARDLGSSMFRYVPVPCMAMKHIETPRF